MTMEEPKVNGITSKTVENILLGAGTFHKNLKYSPETGWNFGETLIGATNGGGKFEGKANIYRPKVDDAYVVIKELTTLMGGTAKMDINFAELTPDLMKAAAFLKEGKSVDATCKVLDPKPVIEPGDFWDNIAFVGHTIAGQYVIIIMENALCTSGLNTEGKSKDNGAIKTTFECHQTAAGDTRVLPWHVYYPAAGVVLKAQKTQEQEQAQSPKH